jgi:5-hydroxyisourate hydrolase
MSISTHVLDATLGRPARGMNLTLGQWAEDGSWTTIGSASTDDDGRAPELTTGLDLPVGVYRLTFGTGDYFARAGTETFYPVVELTFGITDPGAHHHVPLLLSPFAFSTYRGS